MLKKNKNGSSQSNPKKFIIQDNENNQAQDINDYFTYLDRSPPK